MKKYTFLVSIFFFIYFLNSSAQESNALETINKVKVSSGILMEIERSENYSLSINSSEPDTSCLVKTIENGILTLKISNILSCEGQVTARLSCPYLKEIEISGNAEVSTFNVIKGDSLKIIQRSRGKSNLDLDVDFLEVNLSEGSILTANGYADKQVVNVTTEATFSAFELESEQTDIQASLGGKGKVCATDKLKALSKIGGYISYTCEPATAEIEKKGNGVIEKLSE